MLRQGQYIGRVPTMADSDARRWKCEAILPCGHPCGRLGCNDEERHKTSAGCREPCSRKCPRGHTNSCQHFCFEPCGFISCKMKMRRKLKCGHYVSYDCCEAVPECYDSKCMNNPVFAAMTASPDAVQAKNNGGPTRSGNKSKTDEKAIQKKACRRTCPRGHTCSIAHDGDFQCPPCSYMVERRHNGCKHTYQLTCGESGDVSEPLCTAKCDLKLKCGHICEQICSVECDSIPCQVKRQHKFERCGHTCEVSCSEKEPLCQQIVTGAVAQCGHGVTVPCYYTIQDSKFLNRFCQEKCSANLSCGHTCAGNCYKCHLGRFHIRCREKCGKPIICGHYCDTGCSNACPPCSKPCENYCEHGPCPKTCGVPCAPCQLPCKNSCPHHKCTMMCGQFCNRPVCNKHCTKQLTCGHRCVGFCGEPCSPLCLLCDTEKLLEENMGMIDIDTSSQLRFVYLIKCGHTIEASILQQWLQTKSEGGEIKPKQCPLCRTTIWNCRRFRYYLQPAINEIMLVKRKIYGEQNENGRKRYQLVVTLDKQRKRSHMRFSFFFDYLKTFFRLGVGQYEQPKIILDALDELILIYSNAEDFMETYNSLIPMIGLELIELAHTIITSVAKCFDYVFTKLKSTELPLTQQEATDASNELARIEHFRQLLEMQYSHQAFRQPNAKLSRACLGRLEAAARHVANVYSPYSIAKQEIFRRKLKDVEMMFGTTLGITDRERMAIVQVFGTKTGRWFKCRNGHIYVVTECGGPTQQGICNECGVPIGGEHHALLQDNQLATEMDGADQPLYPTALIR